MSRTGYAIATRGTCSSASAARQRKPRDYAGQNRRANERARALGYRGKDDAYKRRREGNPTPADIKAGRTRRTRPARLDLVRLGMVCPLFDSDGKQVTRLAPSGARSLVWVHVDHVGQVAP